MRWGGGEGFLGQLGLRFGEKTHSQERAESGEESLTHVGLDFVHHHFIFFQRSQCVQSEMSSVVFGAF